MASKTNVSKFVKTLDALDKILDQLSDDYVITLNRHITETVEEFYLESNKNMDKTEDKTNNVTSNKFLTPKTLQLLINKTIAKKIIWEADNKYYTAKIEKFIFTLNSNNMQLTASIDTEVTEYIYFNNNEQALHTLLSEIVNSISPL